MRRATAQLPLHTGKAPPWLFDRMWRLAGAVTMAVVDDRGPAEMLRRLADPWWFQAFGCVLGFDWHSSGVTTVTCGAMKEAYKRMGAELGLHVAGGKGATSRHTPREIAGVADRFAIPAGERLIHASKLSAKVDSAALQDHYDLYHHSFFFTTQGQWCVVQQGMNDATRYARRYHWLGDAGAGAADDQSFVNEPHNAVTDLTENSGETFAPAERPAPGEQLLLNMVAAEAGANRDASAELVRWNPDKLLYEARKLTEGPSLFAPAHHALLPEDANLSRLEKIVRTAHGRNPGDFAALLGTEGVGAATVRSLSLLAELIYDAPASHRDPAYEPPPAGALATTSDAPKRRWADYAYAHGGKDGTPFPVDRRTYDESIAVLTDAVRRARVGDSLKSDALKRLAKSFGDG
jgi:hypothetical protein